MPVFSFGENDVGLICLLKILRNGADELSQIYQQMPNEKGTTVYKLQRKFQSVFGFTLPLFHGRGLLNCMSFRIFPCEMLPDALCLDNVGLMPYRRRIVAVSEWIMFASPGLGRG